MADLAATEPDNRLPWFSRSGAAELLALAWPIILAMLGDSTIFLVDSKIVGKLGDNELAGVSVAQVFMYLNYVTVFGYMRGVKVRTAYAVGRGESEHGVAYAKAGAFIGAFVGVLVWAVGRDLSWVFRLVGIAEAIIPIATEFYSAVTWGAPGIFVMSALIQHRQAIGDSRTPMIVTIAGNIANAVLAYGLAFGSWGLPRLGLQGAGYATAIVTTLNGVVLVALLFRHTKNVQSKLPLTKAAAEVTSLGAPTGLQFGLELLAMTTFTSLLGAMSAAEVAAHHIALGVIRFSFLPGTAISEATSVLVGQALGRKAPRDAELAARTGIVLALLFMGGCGIVFAFFGSGIARWFRDSDQVVAIATKLLLVAAVFQLADAVNIVLRGALRGAKDARYSAVLSVTAVWVCIPTAAYFLGRKMGLGALGGWYGFLAETTLAAALLYRRWSSGSWRQAHNMP